MRGGFKLTYRSTAFSARNADIGGAENWRVGQIRSEGCPMSFFGVRRGVWGASVDRAIWG